MNEFINNVSLSHSSKIFQDNLGSSLSPLQYKVKLIALTIFLCVISALVLGLVYYLKSKRIGRNESEQISVRQGLPKNQQMPRDITFSITNSDSLRAIFLRSIAPATTMGEIKKELSKRLNTDASKLIIVLREGQVAEDHMQIQDYEIGSKSTIHCTIRKDKIA